MSSNVRVGDIFVGVCCCHPPIPCIPSAGAIVTGSSVCSMDGLPTSRVGDIGVGFCGHPTVIVSGSSVVSIDSANAARTGDAVAGCICGALVTGSPDTSSN